MSKSWQPITEKQLNKRLSKDIGEFDTRTRNLWEMIQLSKPDLWQQHPWGDEGCGFWVIAIFGNNCIYFNDITQQYSLSKFKRWGRIKDFSDDEKTLASLLQPIIDDISPQPDEALEEPQ